MKAQIQLSTEPFEWFHEYICYNNVMLISVTFVHNALNWALYYVWFQNKFELYNYAMLEYHIIMF